MVFQNDLECVDIILLIINDQDPALFLVEESDVDLAVVAGLNFGGCILVFYLAPIRPLLQSLRRMRKRLKVFAREVFSLLT